MCWVFFVCLFVFWDFFFLKIKMMDLWLQIEGTKLTFIMNISVLDFFKFASRMPQIAQILVSTFNIFRGSMPPDPPTNFLFFFFHEQFQALLINPFEIQDCRGNFTTNLSTRLAETSVITCAPILFLPWLRSACFGLAQSPFRCSGNLEFSGLLIAAASADNKPRFRESLCLFKHRWCGEHG